jgi:hypothetical protein
LTTIARRLSINDKKKYNEKNAQGECDKKHQMDVLALD